MRMRVGSYFVPSSELEWTFGPSGGPGGQHANRSNTRATLRFDLAASRSIPEEVKDLILHRLGPRAPTGTVSVTVDETRSQLLNREIAVERLTHLLSDALRPVRSRRPTRPTAASRQRRLDDKRRRSERKRERRPDWS